MAPKFIYSRWDKFCKKVSEIEKIDIEGKRIGKDITLAFEIEYLNPDRAIHITDRHILDRWIEARGNGEPLVLAPPPTKQPHPTKSSPTSKVRRTLVKVRPKNAARNDQSSKHVASTSNDKQVSPQDPPRPNESSRRLSPKPIESPRQVPSKSNGLPKQAPPKSNDNRHVTPKSNGTSKNIAQRPSETSKHVAQKSDEQPALNPEASKAGESPGSIRENTQSSSQLSTLSEASNQPSSESDAICRGEIDQLVISEPMDEFRFDDDDFEMDTQLHKSMKKIRSDPVPQKEQPNHTRPPPPAPAPHVPTAPIKPFTATPQPPVEPIPKVPPEKKEPNWAETSKQLQNNQFHNVYKDLEHFKDRIYSDNKARSLVPEAVIKCLQEDETNPLSDLLSLIYSLDFYKDDKDFWSELLLRLKRKIQPHSLYKSRSCPNTVRANYRRVLEGVLEYAASANLKLTLNFNDIVYFVTHTTQRSIPALASSKIEPDVKPQIKQDRQENVDPSIVRRVTLIKDSHGKPSFKIVRPLNVNASKPLKPLIKM